eukprot:scaffold2423_cov113-Isochrysis_galbana.AAC.17
MTGRPRARSPREAPSSMPCPGKVLEKARWAVQPVLVSAKLCTSSPGETAGRHRHSALMAK